MTVTGTRDAPLAAEPPREDAVFALFDGDYHLGLGALVNSLYRHGFRGIVYAAYRGALPPWARTAVADGRDHLYEVAPGCAIRFVPVDFHGHLTNYKPSFMLSALEQYCSDAKRLFYFDVDIVIKCPWSFLQHWAECGAAVVQNTPEPNMSANHPIRRYWKDFATSLGYACRECVGYFNGGFLALRAQDAALLRTWRDLMEQIERSGTSLANFSVGDRTNPLMQVDQDALNIALMATSVPISDVDPAGMDLLWGGGYIMAHALARPKPWRRRYLLEAMLGYPPENATKLYWKNVATPIEVFGTYRRILACLSIACAAAVGRFYRRG